MRRRVLLISLGVAGLWLYLWPALKAPVVVWSDGQVDMRWAREGIGLWRPYTPEEERVTAHPLKPGYLLYLRLAMFAVPGVSPGRSAVLVQSILLWLSITLTSAYLARRRGLPAGIAAYVLLLLFIHLRDSASSVMSEAISAALFLPLAASAIDPPRGRSSTLIGVALVALFWIRPNVGGVAFLLLLAGWALAGRFQETLRMAGVFLALIVALWALTLPYGGPDPTRGLADPVLFGSAEYDWAPSLGAWPRQNARTFQGPLLSDPRLRQAAGNWRRTLAKPAADWLRELGWRAGHGLFGLEYYDARWSPLYRRLHHGLRLAASSILLASIATALAFRFGAANRSANAAAFLLLPTLILHNLVFGSSPRLLLPFAAGVLLLGARSAFSGRDAAFVRRAAVLFAGGAALMTWSPAPASWDWGQIEATGVTLEQWIPRGALPAPRRGVTVTLHVRVASPVPDGGAHFSLSADDHVLYRSAGDSDRTRAYITAPLPAEVLEKNARGPVTLRVTSTGIYGPDSYLLFPIVPPPWRAGARRVESRELSPATDVRSGALDWWAHSGDR